jgi:hypothetical protein
MKIKLKTQYSGPNGSHAPGSIVDFDQAEAYTMIEGGFAEQVPEPAKETPAAEPQPAPAPEVVETAVLSAPETTQAPANKRPHRRKK